MPSFAQTHSRVTSYYILQDLQDIRKQLVHVARWKKAGAHRARPGQRVHRLRIIARCSKRSWPSSPAPRYLAHVIFGLDQADEKADVRLCIDICRENNLSNYLIQWNDGPANHPHLRPCWSEGGFDLSRRGKGRNVFMGFGVAMALGATCVGLLDADIKTFQRRQLDRLFYPVLGAQLSRSPRPSTPATTASASSGGSSACCWTPCCWPLSASSPRAARRRCSGWWTSCSRSTTSSRARWPWTCGCCARCATPWTGGWRSSPSSRSSARPPTWPR